MINVYYFPKYSIIVFIKWWLNESLHQTETQKFGHFSHVKWFLHGNLQKIIFVHDDKLCIWSLFLWGLNLSIPDRTKKQYKIQKSSLDWNANIILKNFNLVFLATNIWLSEKTAYTASRIIFSAYYNWEQYNKYCIRLCGTIWYYGF